VGRPKLCCGCALTKLQCASAPLSSAEAQWATAPQRQLPLMTPPHSRQVSSTAHSGMLRLNPAPYADSTLSKMRLCSAGRRCQA
jgi:hypothetical protein